MKQEEILTVIAWYYGITVEELKSKKRPGYVMEARFAAYTVLNKIKGMTLQQTGAALGGKNHATIIYGIETFEAWRKNEIAVRNNYEGLLLWL